MSDRPEIPEEAVKAAEDLLIGLDPPGTKAWHDQTRAEIRLTLQAAYEPLTAPLSRELEEVRDWSRKHKADAEAFRATACEMEERAELAEKRTDSAEQLLDQARGALALKITECDEAEDICGVENFEEALHLLGSSCCDGGQETEAGGGAVGDARPGVHVGSGLAAATAARPSCTGGYDQPHPEPQNPSPLTPDLESEEGKERPTKQEPPEHQTSVDISAGYSGPGYYVAECRCGWSVAPCKDKATAEEFAARHPDEAASEGSGAASEASENQS